MTPRASSFFSPPAVLATPLAFQSRQSFAPSASLSQRVPFGAVPGLIDQLHLHALFPLLSPLLQPRNYITLLVFAPTGPSKGVAAK
jgi:hypothetical protein